MSNQAVLAWLETWKVCTLLVAIQMSTASCFLAKSVRGRLSFRHGYPAHYPTDHGLNFFASAGCFWYEPFDDFIVARALPPVGRLRRRRALAGLLNVRVQGAFATVPVAHTGSAAHWCSPGREHVWAGTAWGRALGCAWRARFRRNLMISLQVRSGQVYYSAEV